MKNVCSNHSNTFNCLIHNCLHDIWLGISSPTKDFKSVNSGLMWRQTYVYELNGEFKNTESIV